MIAHAGYMLIGFVAGGPRAAAAVLFYLLRLHVHERRAPSGSCSLSGAPGDGGGAASTTSPGSAARHPVLGPRADGVLLSLAGIPPHGRASSASSTSSARAVRGRLIWLAVIGVLNSAVAAYYYLRVIVYMYMREPERPADGGGRPGPGRGGLALACVGLGHLPARALARAGPDAHPHAVTQVLR